MEFGVWDAFLEQVGIRSCVALRGTREVHSCHLFFFLLVKWLSIPKAARWWLIIGPQVILLQLVRMACCTSIDFSGEE